MTIKHNRAQCLNCKEVVESMHRHDWVACSCWEVDPKHGIFVDGGHDYLRYGYRNKAEFKPMFETEGEPEPKEEIDEEERPQDSQDTPAIGCWHTHVCRSWRNRLIETRS